MPKVFIRPLAFLILVAAMCSVSFGGRPELIEVNTGDDVYRGQAVAHNETDFWLLQQDGRLRRLSINTVGKFRTLAPKFQGFRSAEMKAELRKEFARGFEVVSTTHYVVAGPPDRARKFAELFESVYRSFRTTFGARGFTLSNPEFPLVAIVFKDQEQFVRYAKRDGVTAATRILGYYHLQSNRVALFDEPNAELTRGPSAPAAHVFARAGVDAPTLKETIIHESMHQAAFNTGLHSRIGPDPRWVVEGLATVFESPGVRSRTGGRGAASRINRGLFQGFRRYVASGRARGSLKAFIAGDSLVSRNLYHFYSESWALTFFLLETRSAQYSKYLKIIRDRNPLAAYGPRERTADFQKAFGTDLDGLEASYLRFIGGL